MLRFDRKQQNSVKQLSFNQKNKKEKNDNGLNTLIKNQSLSGWIKKQEQLFFVEINFKYKDTVKLKVNWWKNVHHSKSRRSLY